MAHPAEGHGGSADPQAFLEGEYGRLRTVVSAGGDKLWLVTSNTDGRGDPEEGTTRSWRYRCSYGRDR